MFNTNIGKIEKFINVEQEYRELFNQIDSACRQFCSEKIDGCYVGWGFNDRKTIIIITYSYTKNGEAKIESEYVSFNEIENILRECEPKNRQIDDD